MKERLLKKIFGIEVSVNIMTNNYTITLLLGKFRLVSWEILFGGKII